MVLYSEDRAAESFRARLSAYLRWSVVLSVLFCVTYGLTNWAASTRAVHSRLFFEAELSIPFVPWMIWVYLSLQIFLAIPLFVLNATGISRLGRAFVAVTLAAAAAHLLLPTELGWVRPATVPGYPIFEKVFVITSCGTTRTVLKHMRVKPG